MPSLVCTALYTKPLLSSFGPAHSFPVPFLFPTQQTTQHHSRSPSPAAALHPKHGVDVQAPPLAQGGPGGPASRGLGRGLPGGHGHCWGSDGGECWGVDWVGQGGRQNKRTKLKMKWEGAAFPCPASGMFCVCVWLRLGGTRRMAVVTVSWSLCVVLSKLDLPALCPIITLRWARHPLPPLPEEGE